MIKGQEQFDFMTEMTNKANSGTILDYIPSGENHAVSMTQLGDLLGVDTRTVRHLIQDERINGHIICGTDSGLFRPVNDLELKEYITRTKARILTSVRTLLPALHVIGQTIECEVHDE